jgi:hypothetical protein
MGRGQRPTINQEVCGTYAGIFASQGKRLRVIGKLRLDFGNDVIV